MASYSPVSEGNQIGHHNELRPNPSRFNKVKREYSFSNSNRFGMGRKEMGDSTKSGHHHESGVTTDSRNNEANTNANFDSQSENTMNAGDERRKRSWSRSRGGFLLSNSIFERPSQHRRSFHEPQRMSHLTNTQKNNTKNRSNSGARTESSLLATKNDFMELENEKATEDKADTADRQPIKMRSEGTDEYSGKGTSVAFDMDSAHIVNLALNLSENRHNASRRVMPLPQASSSMAENMGGGSLRQNLQNQRRIPRAISPNYNQISRSFTASRHNKRTTTPLQAAYKSHGAQAYQYYFSSSTLARAEKARITIELMAQYRRLLQFVPPLKPNIPERSKNVPLILSDHSASSTISPLHNPVEPVTQLGRKYNPLQYIRNRKLRARISRSIDGEAQGFGDIERVTHWVDNVAKVASACEFQNTQNFFLPSFRGIDEQVSPSAASPRSCSVANPGKVKRPRIDWVINPADLIADVYWLEQGNNKKLIEDCDGNMIFPSSEEFRRSISRDYRDQEVYQETLPSSPKQKFGILMDANSPDTRQFQNEPQRLSDTATSIALQKLRVVRDATLIHHGSDRRSRRRFRSRSISSSPSLSSDIGYSGRSRGRISEDFEEHAKNVLERQMTEMIAKEEIEKELNLEGNKVIQSIESPKSAMRLAPRNQNHRRSSTVAGTELTNCEFPGRLSTETYGVMPRLSLDWRDSASDSTAPNSPKARAINLRNGTNLGAYIDNFPSAASSTPRQRSMSALRTSVSSVLQAHNHTRKHDENEELENTRRSGSIARTTLGPDSKNLRGRSLSPEKQIFKKLNLGSNKSGKHQGNIGRLKPEGDRLSGIRGFLKSPRNPVVRFSEFIWKKDSVPAGSFNFPTDESDSEDLPARQLGNDDLRIFQAKGEQKFSRGNSLEGYVEEKNDSTQQNPSIQFKNGQILATPFELSEMKANNLHSNPSQQTKQGLPRIDVQSASPAPSTSWLARFRSDSAASGLSSNCDFRSIAVLEADSRLNTALSACDRRRNTLPISELSSPVTNQNVRKYQRWACDDRFSSTGPDIVTNREIVRLKVLLLSSGIKAREIRRRIAIMEDTSTDEPSQNADFVATFKGSITQAPTIQRHRLAARIISEDIQRSSHIWRSNSEIFTQISVKSLLERTTTLQHRLVESLTPITRTAADEADAVSRDLVMNYSLEITHVANLITQMMRRKGARFRWMRRKGWAVLEWALIGIMWWVWFIVMIIRIFGGIGKGIIRAIKWFFWL